MGSSTSEAGGDARRKAKKKKKKKSKRSDREKDGLEQAEPQDRLERSSGVQPPARKKRRHEKKKSKKIKVDGSDLPTNKSATTRPSAEDSDQQEPVLEGRLVDGTMVLLDHSRGLVFSSEVDDTGTRIAVGTIQGGKVILKDSDDSTNGHDLDGFPFEVDPDDHCESPVDAYEDIAALLKACGSDIAIYDPYYCNGAVIKNLTTLGFSNVYNKKEDCYQVWQSASKYPSYDVLVTNPPYSGDHIAKLMRHVCSTRHGSRPWFLLMPQWVHKKDYFLESTKQLRPFFLVPRKKRYVYLPPPSFRGKKKSDTHKKSSPFVSMWYIWGGTPQMNEQLIRLAQKISTCDMARSKSALRDLRRKPNR